MADTLPKIIIDAKAMGRIVERIAHQIFEENGGSADLALVGVVTKGDLLAGRLHDAIKRIDGGDVPVGRLDITLYRDDLSGAGPNPLVRRTEIPFDITGLTVILVDDVCYTGRTTRAALDALMDYGRPTAIRFAVLVDRGHRELPIRPDYAGLEVVTRTEERVKVELAELGGKDRVWLLESGSDWVPGEE